MAAQEAQLLDSKEFIEVVDRQFSGNDYTIERKQAFIQGLVDTHTVYRACIIAGICKKTAYNWYANDAEFADAWEEALDNSTDNLESSIYEKALNGDTISGIFLLKGYRPKFRDKVTIDLDSIRDEIQQRMEQIGTDRLPELPAVVTQFIPAEVFGSSESMPNRPACEQIQKESDSDSSSESSSE